MYNIYDICGTVYVNTPTLLGDIFQTILWARNYLNQDDIPWSYRNIMSIVEDSCRFRYKVDVITHEVYHGNGDHEDKYCSYVTSQMPILNNTIDLVSRWMQIFDLNLHDAAVTYTYNNEPNIACDLWMLSRQLRLDSQRDDLKKYYNG